MDQLGVEVPVVDVDRDARAPSSSRTRLRGTRCSCTRYSPTFASGSRPASTRARANRPARSSTSRQVRVTEPCVSAGRSGTARATASHTEAKCISRRRPRQIVAGRRARRPPRRGCGRSCRGAPRRRCCHPSRCTGRAGPRRRSTRSSPSSPAPRRDRSPSRRGEAAQRTGAGHVGDPDVAVLVHRESVRHQLVPAAQEQAPPARPRRRPSRAPTRHAACRSGTAPSRPGRTRCRWSTTRRRTARAPPPRR